MSLVFFHNFSLAAVEGCREGTCIKFESGTYLAVRGYNYGQHPGLTFAIWFKPLNGSGNGAHIFAVGNTANQQHVVMARHGDTSNLMFGVQLNDLAYLSPTKRDKMVKVCARDFEYITRRTHVE
jgi:hypothetical protein